MGWQNYGNGSGGGSNSAKTDSFNSIIGTVNYNRPLLVGKTIAMIMYGTQRLDSTQFSLDIAGNLTLNFTVEEIQNIIIFYS